MSSDTIFFIFEIIGTVVFAVTGVITSLEKKLDIFGAIVLGMVTAVGGGIVRDMILGYLPPMAFRNPVYALTALGTSIAAFTVAWFVGKRIKSHFDVYSQVINIFDSIGLAVFTVGGVNAAASCGFGENSFLAVFVGVLTGVGGGVMRDIMAGRVPVILYKRVYALAALIGALVYQIVIDNALLSEVPAVLLGTGIILVIRILATVFHWNLPKIKDLSD